MRLVLASASPRRAEILRDAGIAFEMHATEVDESLRTGESSQGYVRRLALEKARAAERELAIYPARDALIVGADTVVVIGEEILGKPSSAEDAGRMLRLLSGRTHEVHTGLALLRQSDGTERVVDEVTRVTFALLAPEEIESYLATGEPMDKAGSYAIQGIAGRYITRIEGCYFNVMGLPLARLWIQLREFDCGIS
jgi:septum formation protein